MAQQSVGRVIRRGIAGFGIVFIVLATVWALYLNYFAPPPEKGVSTTLPPGSVRTEEIDETPKSDEQKHAYSVPADKPKSLRIPSIGVYANVLSIGLEANGALDSPKTAVDVGWYNGSGSPGTPGAMLIDGHVQGIRGPAVFTNLRKLQPGATITLERGDGVVYTYEVTKVEQKPVADVDMSSLLEPFDKEQGLNLITCGGTYDYGGQTFNDRILVYSKRIA